MLDADGDGTAGGGLTWTFTTVSLAGLPGTSLSGTLVDPGADLKVGTFDDVRPGPDGVLMTADDVYLHTIANVKIYILGLENQTVFTDAQGHFVLQDIPVGKIKLVVDGRTATNAPPGFYFPEMTMELNIRPTAANTVMAAMQTDAVKQQAMTETGVYLPRLQTSLLNAVSATQPTTVGVDGLSAPDLGLDRSQFLTLTVQPGSILGADGLPLANPQIGISTVPPEMVQDMLPPELRQRHTFEITIQAPGATVFSTPVEISFPNFENAAPGTKVNIFSFDHTTGLVVRDGTGTVSKDGLYVVSDAGSGIRAPGWHFVATGTLEFDASHPFGQPDGLTKPDHNSPSLLKSEYPSLYVNSSSEPTSLNSLGKHVGEAALAASETILGHDSVALGFFTDWETNNVNNLASLNQIASRELFNDSSFRNVAYNDIHTILDTIISHPNQRGFDITLTPSQFSPATKDLRYSYGGVMRVLSVSGEGDISNDGKAITDGTLTYNFAINYGYGFQESHNRLSLFGVDSYFLRMMQLGGRGWPFPTSVSVAVHIVNSKIDDSLAPNNSPRPFVEGAVVPPLGDRWLFRHLRRPIRRRWDSALILAFTTGLISRTGRLFREELTLLAASEASYFLHSSSIRGHFIPPQLTAGQGLSGSAESQESHSDRPNSLRC